MRMFRRTAIAVGIAGIAAVMATVRAGAGPLPTSIATLKAAAPSAVVEARWGGGWRGGGWGGGGWRGGGWGRGWGAGAFVGGLAAGAIIAGSSYGYYQNAYYGGYPYYGAYAPGYAGSAPRFGAWDTVLAWSLSTAAPQWSPLRRSASQTAPA